jgi:general secretion pathway protein M
MSAADDMKAVLAQRWETLAPRERVMVAAMGGALAFLLVWMIAVRPAWRTLEQAPAQRMQADLALLQLQALAAEAKQLRALPPVPQAQAEQVLKSATERLGGKAKLAVQSEKATLTLTGATGEDLRQWLVEARGGAHARPVEATLTRAGDGYNGTLVVAIGSSQ